MKIGKSIQSESLWLPRPGALKVVKKWRRPPTRKFGVSSRDNINALKLESSDG